MVIDFNPRNLKDQKIEIWGHNLVFLNPIPSITGMVCQKSMRIG